MSSRRDVVVVGGIPGRNVVRQIRADRGAARWRRRAGSRTVGRR